MLDKLIEDYQKGLITKDDYITESFKYHSELFNYTKLMRENGVKKIEICSNGVFLQIKRNGKSFKMQLSAKDICDVSTLVLNFGEYETQELEMVMKICTYLERDSVIFDIGANLGWYSLNVLSSNLAYKCYAFEPVQETFHRLTENFVCNGFDVSKLYNFGFYKETAEIGFFYNTEESGASSLANLRENNATIEIVCKMKKMDDFIKEEGIDRLDFIKCDVEGSELFVYQGGKETIEKFKPVIFSEMLRKWCKKLGYHPNNIIEMLKLLGYECFVITGQNKLKKIEEVTEETIETNYFFLHKEKHKNIVNKLCE